MLVHRLRSLLAKASLTVVVVIAAASVPPVTIHRCRPQFHVHAPPADDRVWGIQEGGGHHRLLMRAEQAVG